MREIKFREWETERKTMIVGKREDYDDSIGFRFAHEEGGERILMQYTGLKDKNGVEIYEGDIVIHNGKLSKVKWSEKYCQFRVEGSRATTGLNFYHSRYYEVIGNIYDNPELLEVAK